LGYHVLSMRPPDLPMLYAAELLGCTLLPDLAPDAVMTLFVGALTTAGATVVESVSHRFPGTGQTCVLILAESHAVLHTWPESGAVNLDIFSCSPRLQSHSAITELGRAFGATSISVQEIARADGHARPSTALA
jgi:S-adenosylmethionine decarboxylase